MILADDLGSALSMAGSMAMKYGPTIIDAVKSLWTKYRKKDNQ